MHGIRIHSRPFMNKTIYVRDEDTAIWDRAKELAGDKLAPVIMEGLKKYVAEREAQAKGFERIQIRFHDQQSNGMPRAKAFYGRWIYSPEKPLEMHNENYDE